MNEEDMIENQLPPPDISKMVEKHQQKQLT